MPRNSDSSSGPFPGVGVAKLALRDQLLTTRHRRSLVEMGEAGRAIAGHLLAHPAVRRAATVAAYVSLGGEPGTRIPTSSSKSSAQVNVPAGCRPSARA